MEIEQTRKETGKIYNIEDIAKELGVSKTTREFDTSFL